MMNCAFAVVLALSLAVGIPGMAWANNDGPDSGYRVNDFTGLLTDDQELALSRAARAEVVNLQFDFNIYLTDKADSALSLAKGFYDNNNCGYGEDNDGIILCIKSDGSADVYVEGLGAVIFSDKDVSSLASTATKDLQSQGMYNACYNFLRSAISKVASYRGVDVGTRWPALAASSAGATSGDGAAKEGPSTADLPWYPKDPKAFKDFHNDAATPRVVDAADLLTPEQEQQLAAHIADMQQRTGLDFVLYTDNSSYGLSRGLYAADFYQFNGYGFGDEYSGVIYFVCMEKGNRGFWTAARGTARELLTESNVNAMDDITYDTFVSGDYGNAILTQFDSLDALYTNGHLPIDYTPFVGAGIIALIIGLFSGSKELSTKKKAMKTVANATSAALYSDGLVLTVNNDELYDTEVTRTKHVDTSSSSGGSSSSSSGHSSYSSSYSSSGGASFSGGGRSF